MYVGAEGPNHAKIAFVGEKGGREEVRLGRPFVGPTGREVNDLLLRSGISRSSVYLTNAVKEVNNFDNPTTAEIQAEQLSLYRELSKLPNLSVIVPMGAVALAALSNFQLDSITSYRGSILKSFIGTKMIPTFHPAYYMRGEWRYKPIVKFDIERALEESYSKELNLPQRSYCIAETRQDLDFIYNELSNNVKYISFDIELMRGRYIECIAFSKTPDVAYCIPITNGRRQNYWELIYDEIYAWKTIYAILNQPKIQYIAKNGLFDCWHLWRHGIPTLMENGFDVEYMHRYRAPDLPHDLGFLVSIYTREPYYKDESGSWKEQDRTVTDEQFYIYNCKDAATTLEVFHELRSDMERCGMMDFYNREIHSQWNAVMDMRQRGIKVDIQALRDVRTKLTDKINALRGSIESSAGWVPNTQSSIDMTKFYSELGIAFAKTSKGNAKRDKEILYTYAARYPQHRNVLMDISNLNKTLTQLNGFTSIGLDEQDYYHPQLTINKTATGRLAGKQADEGGPQIQNIPKALRKIFIPDNPLTDELTNADLKGAEAMLLAWFTQDPLLVQGFLQRKDIHRIRAAVIFRDYTGTSLPPDDMLASIKTVCNSCESLGESECNHSERYLGKQSGHAMAYLEGIRRFCQELRKQGIFIDEALAKRIRDKVVSKHIQQWHANVEMALRTKPWLEAPLGRRREFYGIMDQDLLRKALSWLCQTTVGQITGRAMVKMQAKISLIHPQARLITQTHDSITTTHPKEVRNEIIELYREAFHEPMVIHGRELVIPIDITHGPNWGELK